jgi:hypothetical protein
VEAVEDSEKVSALSQKQKLERQLPAVDLFFAWSPNSRLPAHGEFGGPKTLLIMSI